MNLALFDFDGTLTTEDTFTPFVMNVTSTRRKRLGKILLAPLVLGYKHGFVTAHTMRKSLCKFAFWNMQEINYLKLGQQHATHFLPKVNRPEIMSRLLVHQANGDKIAIVSASLRSYLKPWCDSHGLTLLCNDIVTKEGRLTGTYKSADCCGEEKVNRVKAHFDLDQFDKIYAYGDTDEDLAMLKLADDAFLDGHPISFDKSSC